MSWRVLERGIPIRWNPVGEITLCQLGVASSHPMMIVVHHVAHTIEGRKGEGKVDQQKIDAHVLVCHDV